MRTNVKNPEVIADKMLKGLYVSLSNSRGTFNSFLKKKYRIVTKSLNSVKRYTAGIENEKKIYELCDDILSFYEYLVEALSNIEDHLLESLNINNYPNIEDRLTALKSAKEDLEKLVAEVSSEEFRDHLTTEIKKLVDTVFDSLFPTDPKSLSLCLLAITQGSREIDELVADLGALSRKGVRRSPAYIKYNEVKTDEEMSSESVRRMVANEIFGDMMREILIELESKKRFIDTNLKEILRKSKISS